VIPWFQSCAAHQAVENLQYNINVNAQADDDEDADEEERAARRAMRRNIESTTRAAMLDWDEDSEESVGKVLCECYYTCICVILCHNVNGYYCMAL
jgi:hypothetical protein